MIQRQPHSNFELRCYCFFRAIILPLTCVAWLGTNPGPLFAQDHSKTLDLTFDDFKFEMKKGEDFEDSMLTDEIKKLDGKRVKVRGYIKPSLRRKGIAKFVFVRDDKECCFGPGAMIYDNVLVSMSDGDEVDFTVRPITIEGTFFIKKFKGPNGKVWAIYRMRNAVRK